MEGSAEGAAAGSGTPGAPATGTLSATVIAETGTFVLSRAGRFLSARLKGPHMTLSTSQVNGGEQKHLGYLINHQSCEGKGHKGRHDDAAGLSREDYHAAVCGEAGIPPAAAALMGTSANMQNAAVASRTFEEVGVWAAVTAGVQGNAGRAGDEARWHEGVEAWKPLHALSGTINTMLFFDWPLLPGALARAVATMTEAKTAVLQELGVSSRFSPLPATGTGTDQFCLAAPLDEGRKPKTWTGKHGKLGEILALAVMEATREALVWQNGLEPSRTRNLAHALGRYGVEEEALRKAMGLHLGEKDRALMSDNFLGILHEPQAAAAGYALAAVMERISFAVLPPEAAVESLINQAALMAAALAAKPESFPRFRAALAEGGAVEARAAALQARRPRGTTALPALQGAAAPEAEGLASGFPGASARPDLLPLVSRAMAIGWASKWA